MIVISDIYISAAGQKPLFSGEVKISLAPNDIIAGIDFSETDMSAAVQSSIIKHLAMLLNKMEGYTGDYGQIADKTGRHLSVRKVPRATFELFWELYQKKVNKYRCEPLWKKLSESDKERAITQIAMYDKYRDATGYRGKLDPENYLKTRMFDSDFEELIKQEKLNNNKPKFKAQ